MTQMGLDYMKHRENVRHNMASEDVDRRNAASNERNATSNEQNALSNRQNADTNKYVASFKDREVQVQERNAKSNERNASSNERNAASNEVTAQIKRDELNLEQKYKEREMAAKELSAEGTYLRGLASQLSANTDANYKKEMLRIDEHYKSGMLDYYDRMALAKELEQRVDKAYKEGMINLKTRDQLGTLGKILESNASYYGDNILGGFVAGLGSSIYQLVTDFF